MLSLDQIKDELHRHQLKVTHQRLVIYDALQKRLDHPTAEQLHGHLSPVNPTLSLGTIYKTLEAFADAGLIRKVHTDSGSMRYDAKVGEHSHIYATNTAEIIDYDNQELQRYLWKYFKDKKIKNLNIKQISIQIEGEKIDPDKDIKIN